MKLPSTTTCAASETFSRYPVVDQDGWSQTLRLDLPHTADFFHRGRNQLTVVEHSPVIQRVLTFDGQLTSQEFVIVGDVETSRYLLFGAITAERSFTEFVVHRRQGNFTHLTIHQREIANGCEPEELVYLEGSDWRTLLVDYAQRCADRRGVSIARPASNLTGFTSWHYYYQKLSEADFFECVESLASAQAQTGLSFRFAQIDDGYQTHHGDWLDRNKLWHSPMKDVAARIKDYGFEPGIWLMPLLASTASEVFRKHADWFVQKENGDPVLVRGWSPPPDADWACLDATNPDVQRHLQDVLGEMRGWGFTMFKPDGTGFSAPQGLRYDAEATGVSAYRTGLRICREALDGCHVLGCTQNLASFEFMDQCRVSTDNSHRWMAWNDPTQPQTAVDRSEPLDLSVPGLRNALLGTLSQWWQIDRWFRVDPDVVLVRDENTELTLGEVHMNALCAILTGVVYSGDRLDRVSPDRLELLARAMSLRLFEPMPIDWQEHRWPQAFSGTLADGEPAVALFNFSEQPREYDFTDLGLPEICSELLHPAGVVKQRFILGGHDAALLRAENA